MIKNIRQKKLPKIRVHPFRPHSFISPSITTYQFWAMIENLRERLRTVDDMNFLCTDLVQILFEHCHNLKLSDAGKYPGQTTPFLLHPCLKENNSEMKYVRTIAEVELFCAESEYCMRAYLVEFLFEASSLCCNMSLELNVELNYECRFRGHFELYVATNCIQNEEGLFLLFLH